MVEGVLVCGFLMLCGVFGLMFCLMRMRYRQRLRARREPGFYPSTRDLSNAFENLQMFAQPRISYVQEAKLKNLAEDDDSGDDPPEDSALGDE